jgi:membrane protease subunit (stomatin/prohibitin family)
MKRPPRIVRAPDRATASVLVRVPEKGAARLRLGMSCVVGEGQVAAFERGGLTLDVLEAGRHTLSPRTVPNLARLDSRRRTAVEAAVYFVSRRVFTNWSWATREPLRITGKGGHVALRALGTYTFRIVEPRRFLEREVEPRGARDEGDVREGLNEVILLRLGRILETRLSRGRSPTGLRGELATHLRLDLQEAFARRGIELIDFFVGELTVVSEKMVSTPSGQGSEELPQFPIPESASSRPDLFRAGQGPGRPACPHCGSSWNVGGACRACQAEIPAGVRFCPTCGSSQDHRDRA